MTRRGVTRPPSGVLSALVLLVFLATGVGACASTDSDTSLTLLATDEGLFTALKDVFDEFEQEHGVEIITRATRAQDQIRADVQSGTPPDVAILPSTGDLAWYAERGYLHPLENVVGDEWPHYSEQWRHLARFGLDQLYAVPVEVNVKSLVWYRPAVWDLPDEPTLTELRRRAPDIAGDRSLWCVGLGSGPASGWPATDWIESIMLTRFGGDTYQRWATGRLPWTSPEVEQAWMIWEGIVVTDPPQVRGGSRAALLTDFADAGRGLFDDTEAGCLLEHQASFIMRDYQHKYGGQPQPDQGESQRVHFNFVDFENLDGTPAADLDRRRMVAADLAVMFNDTELSQALIQLLISPKAQIALRHERHFSARQDIPPESYLDDVSQNIARMLTADDRRLCFDASDLMPAAMRNAFHRAVQEHLNNPGRRDELLVYLERVRLELVAPGEAGQDSAGQGQWLRQACTP